MSEEEEEEALHLYSPKGAGAACAQVEKAAEQVKRHESDVAASRLATEADVAARQSTLEAQEAALAKEAQALQEQRAVLAEERASLQSAKLDHEVHLAVHVAVLHT